MDTLTDDALVARVLAGDRDAAFAILYARHAPMVRAVALQAVGPPDADDVSQEAFTRAYARLATYVPGDRFGAWLATIAANYCRDMLRRRRFVTVAPAWALERPDPAPGPEAAYLAREAGDALGALVLALPPKERDAVALFHCAAWPYAGIEAALGIPRTTLRMRLVRGRQHLREAFA